MNEINDEFITNMLLNSKIVAIVGASNKPERASNGIMKFLLKNGYNCIPINPNEDEVLGVKAYKCLLDLDVRPDIVDVFRRSEETPNIVKEAALKKAKLIWLQEGIYSEEAKEIADKASIPIIMDKCLFKEYLRLIISKKGNTNTN
ncbi:MAG: CoA-binding protein [Deferribacterota bacterium]|nr:CoA-binding protein [Deferribacterota bacterium]